MMDWALYQVNLIVSNSSLLSLLSELYTTTTVENIHRWTSKVHKLIQDGDWVMPVDQVILPSWLIGQYIFSIHNVGSLKDFDIWIKYVHILLCTLLVILLS